MKRVLSLLLWSVIAAAFIGPGTVTTAASAGAGYGYALLWALAFSTLATLVLQEAAARVTIVSGRNLGEAIRERAGGTVVGIATVLLVLGAIVIGNAAYEAGNILGGVAGAVLAVSVPRPALTLLVALLSAAVLWAGTPRAVAQLLSAAVAVMGIAFLATAARLAPPLPELFEALVVPALPAGSGLLVLGLVGTTVVPYNLFLGSGIAAGQRLGEMRAGLGIAVLLGGLISMAILVVGAAVAGEFSFEALAATLSARLGAAAGPLFGVGLLAAGLSSAITAPLAAAVTAASLFGGTSAGWEPRGWRYRAVWVGVLGVGLLFGLTGIRPVPAIIFAQALNGVLLPVAALMLLLAVNDRILMGDRVNGSVANIALGATVAATVVLGVSGVFRATAAAAAGEPPTETQILLAAAAVATLAAVPVVRAVKQRRARAPAAPVR